ncbi:aldehyde dehydrogenase [Rubrobacter indicoceani]|uniref:aldehyde dehydrogenase n=1 Tax=Rubrobacter indicoceani TaxID=2051957 RepID=UPI000E5C0F75|nr:aldehyde dehydrogenase [Rubrobacter indicoceani]
MTQASTKWHDRAGELSPEPRAFIDGAYTEAVSGKTFEKTTPRDGSLLANVAECDREDVDLAVRAARRAFEDGRWSGKSPAQRKAVLFRFSDLIEENLEELALLESLDVGKPVSDALSVDVPSCASYFRWYAEAIDKRYGEVAPTAPEFLATITREPMGVVGAVVPWNYPLILTAWKAAPALATGNSVVLKPAEQSPLSAILLARLASEAGLPDGVFNVLPGFGPGAGAALGRHPDVDKITFTGSSEVGKLFLKYAGESNMKHVSLECGGKSAHVVFPDAPDLDEVAETVAGGIFYNAGQTCHAGSRVIAHRSVRDELIEKIAAHAATYAPGDPLDPDTTLGTLVDRSQMERVLGYVDLARREGAEVTVGGGRKLPETGGFYVEPTVFSGVGEEMRVAREEIFGPVLSVLDFTDAGGEAEAVRLANATAYGLAGAVWTQDVGRAHRVSGAMRSGTVWVNCFDASDVTVPFGGFKESGTGRDKSLHAIGQYEQLKTTWIRIGDR